MQSYAVFTSKKGRPKLEIHECGHGEEKCRDADPVVSLFLLKQITRDQRDSAQYYEKMCDDYHRSIGAPVMNTTSVVKIEQVMYRSYPTPSKEDEILGQHWLELKEELHRIDYACEELMYKVVVEGKLKYELLNPANVSRNLLLILQKGLDKVTELRRRWAGYW